MAHTDNGEPVTHDAEPVSRTRDTETAEERQPHSFPMTFPMTFQEVADDDR
jgi:hypothetical protein